MGSGGNSQRRTQGGVLIRRNESTLKKPRLKGSAKGTCKGRLIPTQKKSTGSSPYVERKTIIERRRGGLGRGGGGKA